jgi:hypothetical protein
LSDVRGGAGGSEESNAADYAVDGLFEEPARLRDPGCDGDEGEEGGSEGGDGEAFGVDAASIISIEGNLEAAV